MRGLGATDGPAGNGREAGPNRPARWRRRVLPFTPRGRRAAVRVAAGVAALALLPGAWIQVGTASRLRTPRSVPRAPVAVVFGAGLLGRQPSRYLARRLDTAATLYRDHTVRAILVTGDNSRTDYDEPGVMRAYLRRAGVPGVRVVEDHAGFDTWDSCTRAKRIFGVGRAVLVSQAFHIRRAVALCTAAGIDAYGVGVDDHHDLTWYYCAGREVAAADKAVLDAALRPDPHFLGHREPGIARALADAARC